MLNLQFLRFSIEAAQEVYQQETSVSKDCAFKCKIWLILEDLGVVYWLLDCGNRGLASRIRLCCVCVTSSVSESTLFP